MTESQKKILVDAFLLLAAGARTGKRKVESGETSAQIHAHLVEVEAMVREAREAIEKSAGAKATLRLVRAKTLTQSRPR